MLCSSWICLNSVLFLWAGPRRAVNGEQRWYCPVCSAAYTHMPCWFRLLPGILPQLITVERCRTRSAGAFIAFRLQPYLACRYTTPHCRYPTLPVPSGATPLFLPLYSYPTPRVVVREHCADYRYCHRWIPFPMGDVYHYPTLRYTTCRLPVLVPRLWWNVHCG